MHGTLTSPGGAGISLATGERQGLDHHRSFGKPSSSHPGCSGLGATNSHRATYRELEFSVCGAVYFRIDDGSEVVSERDDSTGGHVDMRSHDFEAVDEPAGVVVEKKCHPVEYLVRAVDECVVARYRFARVNFGVIREMVFGGEDALASATAILVDDPDSFEDGIHSGQRQIEIVAHVHVTVFVLVLRRYDEWSEFTR